LGPLELHIFKKTIKFPGGINRKATFLICWADERNCVDIWPGEELVLKYLHAKNADINTNPRI
jgi:hypothetical protein